MAEEQLRERALQSLVELLKVKPFNVEFNVTEKPQGIKIIIDVTQEYLEHMLQKKGKSITPPQKNRL
jgi:predicted RNA-binding protein YlqC (UPF0109 family)